MAWNSGSMSLAFRSRKTESACRAETGVPRVGRAVQLPQTAQAIKVSFEKAIKDLKVA